MWLFGGPSCVLAGPAGLVPNPAFMKRYDREVEGSHWAHIFTSGGGRSAAARVLVRAIRISEFMYDIVSQSPNIAQESCGIIDFIFLLRVIYQAR